MPMSSFTTRIDSDLKERLQTIAHHNQRSASFMANQAIQNFVEEYEETKELIKTGISLAEKGISISDDAISKWMDNPNELPFPEPDTFE